MPTGPDHEPMITDRRGIIAGIAGLSAGVLLAGARQAHAGPLNPPPGPVTPTGKTLSDVQPRRVIRQADFVGGAFTLDQPGAYALGENVAGTLVIGADDVDLNLNGFTVTAAANAAIAAGGTFNRTTIRNGRLVCTTGNMSGVGLAGGGHVFEDLEVVLTVASTSTTRIGVASELSALVRRVRVVGFPNGIEAGASGTHAVISDCVVDDAIVGIRCRGSRAIVERCLLRGLSATPLSNIGIRTGSNALVRDCNVANFTFGIDASGSGTRIDSCLVQLTSTAVQLGARCVLTRSTISVTPTAGVALLGDFSQVLDNTIAETNLGVDAQSRARCLIARNTLSNVTTAFSGVAASSAAGPLVSAANIATQTNPWANVLL